MLIAIRLTGGVSSVIPVDLHVRGCPPSPVQLLLALLKAETSAVK
jgi:Ni,Fe-hydrogenase III small subunit